jgi:hypothetical protein
VDDSLAGVRLFDDFLYSPIPHFLGQPAAIWAVVLQNRKIAAL